MKTRLERATEDGKRKARKELKAEKKAARSAGDEAKAATQQAQAEVAAAMRVVDAVLAEMPEAERAQLRATAGGSATRMLDLFTAWKLGRPAIAPAAAPAASAPAVVVAAPVAPLAAPAAAPVAPVAAAPISPPPLAAPATTAPAGAAPPPPAPGSAENVRAEYEALKESNPYYASQFLLNHQAEIYPDRTFNDVRKASRQQT